MFARLFQKEISDKVTSRIVTVTMDDLAIETFSLIFLRLRKAIPNATLIDFLNYEEDNLIDLLGPLPPRVFFNFKTWLLLDVLNEDEYYSLLLQKNISYDIFISADKRYLRSLNVSNRAKHLVGDKTIAEILSISYNKLKTIPSMGTTTANDIILNVTNYISTLLEKPSQISNDDNRIIDTKPLLLASYNNINLIKEDWIVISDTIYNATSYNFIEKRVSDLACILKLKWPFLSELNEAKLFRFLWKTPEDLQEIKGLGRNKIATIIAIILNLYAFITNQESMFSDSDFNTDDDLTLEGVIDKKIKPILSKKEIEIIDFRFAIFEETKAHTLSEVAQIMNLVSRERVRQIEKNAKRKIRENNQIFQQLQKGLESRIPLIEKKLLHDNKCVFPINKIRESDLDSMPYEHLAIEIIYDSIRNFIYRTFKKVGTQYLSSDCRYDKLPEQANILKDKIRNNEFISIADAIQQLSIDENNLEVILEYDQTISLNKYGYLYIRGESSTNARRFAIEDTQKKLIKKQEEKGESSYVYSDKAQFLFDFPELCDGTYPVECIIKEKSISIPDKKWSSLLIALVEYSISKNMLTNISPDSDSKISHFFLEDNPLSDDFVELSNGKWFPVERNTRRAIRMARDFCSHCGLTPDDITIYYILDPKYKRIKRPRKVHNVETEDTDTVSLDVEIKSQIIDILQSSFSNGFRLSSPIEMLRFRSFYENHFEHEIELDDNDIKLYIKKSGVLFDEKVYIVSSETKRKLFEEVEHYFESGNQIIFYEEFYAKNEEWLFPEKIVSYEMLARILEEVFPDLFFTKLFFGKERGGLMPILEKEILRVWGSETVLTYAQIAERLPYVPLARIKNALGQNSNFIWNKIEEFSHISKIRISDSEKENIRLQITQACDRNGYASIACIDLNSISEENPELSITGLHNAVFEICLSDIFEKKGKIITPIGATLDVVAIMKAHCEGISSISLDELADLEVELTGYTCRWIFLEAAYAKMIRTEKDRFVADKYVNFDIEAIDNAIDAIVENEYMPLKSFSSFATFPYCGQQWTLFLLESYCRRFSLKFRFDTPSTNSRNAGAVIRKDCLKSYVEIMTDAVSKADIPLDRENVVRFLFESGYIGKTTTSSAAEIIRNAKLIRENLY